VSLAQRILLSISALVGLVTIALSLAVQWAWEKAAQQQFEADFNLATVRLRQQLADELTQLPNLLDPLCKHSPMVDSTLIDLQAGSLDRERKYALSLLVPATGQAFGFDELVLLTGSGEILGAHEPSLVGRVDEQLVTRSLATSGATLTSRDGTWQVEAHCQKKRSGQMVLLHAARHLNTIIDRVGALHGLSLSRSPPEDRPERFVRTLELAELRGTALFATPKYMTVNEAVAALNRQILFSGLAVLVVALLLGFWFARRLSKPIVQLSEQAQRVVAGETRPIRATGGKELRDFADSFNRTLDDLTRLRKRLAATERIAAQREIARRVAHEIKNPLAPIRAAIETLRRLRARNDPAFDEYFDDATQTVLGEVRRIATIVREFTEFARLPPPSPSEFDIEQLVRSVVQIHTSEACRVEINAEGPMQIRADRDQCVQVMTNLLQNALDAVANADEPLVQVSLAATGDHIAVQIADNGPGLAADVRDRVFKPYVTTKSGGTGLGLAIVQRIVVEHGGDVSVSESPLGGASFVVSLPIAGPAVVLERSDPSTDTNA